MIDDAVVKAKEAAAEEIAVESSMKLKCLRAVILWKERLKYSTGRIR